jgi:hypothetical protein
MCMYLCVCIYVLCTYVHVCMRVCMYIMYVYMCVCLSQWPCGLRRRSTAARLLGLLVRIPPRAWMAVSCECCVLSGRGLCDELVPRPEKSYGVWCV